MHLDVEILDAEVDETAEISNSVGVVEQYVDCPEPLDGLLDETDEIVVASDIAPQRHDLGAPLLTELLRFRQLLLLNVAAGQIWPLMGEPQGALLAESACAPGDYGDLAAQFRHGLLFSSDAVCYAVGDCCCRRRPADGSLNLHPAQADRLFADPSLGLNASRRRLRCWTPVVSAARQAARHVDVGGSRLRAGDGMLLDLCCGTRNRGHGYGDSAQVGLGPHLKSSGRDVRYR